MDTPKLEAAQIAINTVKLWLAEDKDIEKVYFVVFDEVNYNLYHEILEKE